MTFEQLSKGNSLHDQIMYARNEISSLEQWVKTIEEKDELVWLTSKEKTGEKQKSICILHGRTVLPFIQERIKEITKQMNENISQFENL